MSHDATPSPTPCAFTQEKLMDLLKEARAADVRASEMFSDYFFTNQQGTKSTHRSMI